MLIQKVNELPEVEIKDPFEQGSYRRHPWASDGSPEV